MEPAEGEGTCAGEWDASRLEYKECNMHACEVASVNATKKCHQSLDVILLLDGTPKSGEEGFKAEQKAAKMIVDAFTVEGVSVEQETKCHVYVYQHGDFTGWAAEYEEGDYDYPQFTGKGAANDDQSALVVEGKGCEAELFQHGGFGGWKAVYPEGSYNYHQMLARGARNDDASSLKVKKVKDSKPAGFDGSAAMGGSPNFAVVYYTGPRTWSGVSKCTQKSDKEVDMEKDCHVKIAQHFTQELTEVEKTIDGLKYQTGTKLLSLAMMSTQSELALGRPEARTVVIVFIDGQPLSFRKTLLGSRAIRKKARLVWVAVTKFSPLANLKKWASRRWQENLVALKNSKQWEKAETGTHVIANICPRRFPKLKTKQIEEGGELPPLD